MVYACSDETDRTEKWEPEAISVMARSTCSQWKSCSKPKRQKKLRRNIFFIVCSSPYNVCLFPFITGVGCEFDSFKRENEWEEERRSIQPRATPTTCNLFVNRRRSPWWWCDVGVRSNFGHFLLHKVVLHVRLLFPIEPLSKKFSFLPSTSPLQPGSASSYSLSPPTSTGCTRDGSFFCISGHRVAFLMDSLVTTFFSCEHPVIPHFFASPFSAVHYSD